MIRMPLILGLENSKTALLLLVMLVSEEEEALRRLKNTY